MLEWLEANKNIVFSGLGTGLLIFVLGKLFANKLGVSQKQKSGKGSTNIQIGGDIKISNKPGSDE